MLDSRTRIATQWLVRLVLSGTILFFCRPVPTEAAGAATPFSPKRLVTDNGMTVVIQEAHSLPVVNVQVIVKAGAVLDTDDKAGLANLTAELLDEGTATRSATQIADAVDFIGAGLSADGGEDYATASLRVLKKDLNNGMDLLSDILLHPSFPEPDLERKRQEILGEIISEKDQPGEVADKAFNQIVFGAHPYHRPSEGTEQTLPGITRADVSQFYERYYHPNNTIMTIVGDITEAEALDLLKTYFGSWARAPIPTLTIPPAVGLEKPVVKLIDKNLTQANIILGHLGIDRKNPDYYAVTVMNYILGGGGFSSRLMTKIRDNQGLAYSIDSHFDASAFPGSFTISLQTRNAAAQVAIDGAMAELRKIRTAPVTDRELENAKAFLIGSFPLRIDTSAKIAGFLAQIEYYDLGLDYAERYPKLIRSITKTDVQRVAQKYLDPDHLALVVVAKQDEAKIRPN
ncbi:MAG TPA: pitrilysin family protein [Nitrospiria bacterium]|jgi:zinc protease|nr:pitrilysin family protein [Nitrospiria bacterium]